MLLPLYISCIIHLKSCGTFLLSLSLSLSLSLQVLRIKRHMHIFTDEEKDPHQGGPSNKKTLHNFLAMARIGKKGRYYWLSQLLGCFSQQLRATLLRWTKAWDPWEKTALMNKTTMKKRKKYLRPIALTHNYGGRALASALPWRQQLWRR